MTEKTWPDDAREKWRAIVFTGERGVRHLMVSAQIPGGKRVAVLPLSWVPREPFEIAKPVLSESFEEERDGLGDVTNFLQVIVDAAWEAGIKPVQAKAGDGEIGAVNRHLEDMRSMVFRHMDAIDGKGRGP